MTDQNTFMEVLREVSEIMRTSESPLSETEIMAYFADMDLNEGQKKLIADYLNNLPELDEAFAENADIYKMEGENGQSGLDEASEDSKVLRAYMEDLSLIKTYSDEEKIELYGKLLEGEEEVIDTISALWLSNVLDIAKKYMDLHSRLEDLIQEGNVALLLRLNDLCGAKTVEAAFKDGEAKELNNELAMIGDEALKLEKILSYSVEKCIMEYISEWKSAKEQEDILVGKLSLIHEAKRYLEAENGTAPTVGELAEYTKMSVEELSGYMDYLKDLSGRK